MAGLPLEYAALTMPAPPVERMTPVRLWRINSFVPWMVASLTHCTMPCGAPAASAASASTRAVSQVHLRARGCGLSTIAFPAFNAIRHL